MKNDKMSVWHKMTDLQRSRRNQTRRDRFAKDRAENNDAHKARSRAYKRVELKNDFGVSLEWFEEQVLSQGGVCYICKRPPGKKRLSVDHCHNTGEVRKLLCHKCNIALGLVREDMSILDAMIGYLEEHSK